ncbi:MAG: ATP-binding cassette domain-containing protein [Verrucomicrobiota bacterium]
MSSPVLEFLNARIGHPGGLRIGPVNWRVHPGEQWAILGPNRSGKSILAAAIAGEIPVRQGECIPGWSDPAGLRPFAARLSLDSHRAVLAGETSFHQSRWHHGIDEAHRSVSDYLSLDSVEAINPYQIDSPRSPRSDFLRRRRDAIGLLNLRPLWSRKLGFLSNGEMRRVLLAHTFLRNPALLVLDEPFSGLDTRTRRLLRRVLNELCRRGQQILLATSRPDEIPECITHVLLLQRNRIVAQGPRRPLLQHTLVRQLRTDRDGGYGRSKPGRASALLLPSVFSSLRRDAMNKPRRSETKAGGREGRVEGGRFHPANPVEFHNISLRAGKRWLLRDVNWTVRPGERWCLLGPNGSGKTTLLSLIQGDNPLAYGLNLRLFGLSPDSTQALWHARQFIGSLSPELHLHYPPDWNCLDVVCSGYFDSIGLHQACSSRRRARARALLRTAGLARAESDPLGSLPLVDQRLVLLARALVKKPRLLILDEPCQSLDRHHRQRVLGIVDQFLDRTPASLIFVTHHRGEIPRAVKKILQLNRGIAKISDR